MKAFRQHPLKEYILRYKKYIVEIHTSNIIIEKNHKADITQLVSFFNLQEFETSED